MDEVWGGDACVALVPFPSRLVPPTKGDASVPTLPPNHPRPYETTPLPSSFQKNLPVKGHPRPYGDERAPEAQPQIPIPESASATPAPTGKPGFFLLHLTLIVLAFGWAHTSFLPELSLANKVVEGVATGVAVCAL